MVTHAQGTFNRLAARRARACDERAAGLQPGGEHPSRQRTVSAKLTCRRAEARRLVGKTASGLTRVWRWVISPPRGAAEPGCRAPGEGMMVSIERVVGIALTTAVLAGCLPVRPQLPAPPGEPKHPFPEEPRKPAERTPAIQKAGYTFTPPEFPQESFQRSQQSPLEPIKPPPPQPVVAIPETAKREPLAEAIECILANRHDEAVRHLQVYDPQTQDWFLRLLPALSILTRKKIQDLDTAEVAVLHEQLLTLLSALRPKTELTIEKACFCEWIKSYGNYKPLPEGYAFVAPSANRPGECVQLYFELRNFASELRKGQYETRLATTVEIRDRAGSVMWSYRFEDENQTVRSRTQLHDHYCSYSFHVPKNIPPGVYSLIVQIADETNPDSRRLTSKALDFRVAPAPLRVATH
jgi:hypothetical protein